MAGPVPTYLSTQVAAQTAFAVSFGLLTLVNNAITAATTAGQFNVTVDCSLFTAEDVSNLRIYLDSQGYTVEFAKDSNQKSLNIDWGRFLDIPGMTSTVNQGTSPWIISGTVAATQSGPWTVSLSSGSIEIGTVDQGHAGSESWLVDVTNTVPVTGTFFQAVQPISGTVTANAGSGTFLVDGSAHTQPISGSVSVSNFPATQPVSGTITALQGTSPWVVSGSISTSPDVNIHDSAGNVLSSTGAALNVNVVDFPSIQGVSQSGTWSTGRTWALLNTTDSVNVGNFPASTAVTQGTSPWVVSGTVTANAGTGTFLVDGSAHTQPISAASLPLPTGAATEATLSTLNSNVAKEFGTWNYYAGTSGTVSVTAGQRVVGMGCHSTAGGSFTINGGASVTVPANVGISIKPKGNITAPMIIFTSTDSYFVETVS